ncbi:Hypothetical predicted protein [Octopus vulgaris]|uniref:Uncharacterized protein n=1 Tax=Octopus vulgaris TaxID=6645 RepID=A0AA36AKL9_OCTVU|nr:Hypothetical predicted protein [Octopus vulgaris]
MLHIIENPKVTAENYPTVEDEWLFHQNCAKRIHTYLFGVSEATKLEFSKYYQLSAAKDREWLPIRKRPESEVRRTKLSYQFQKGLYTKHYLLVTEGNSNWQRKCKQ